MMKTLKVCVSIALIFAVGIFLYRLLFDEAVSSLIVSGLIFVLAFLLLTLLSDRITELSVGTEGLKAKMADLTKGVSDIKTFLFGSIDDKPLRTLKAISEGNL